MITNDQRHQKKLLLTEELYELYSSDEQTKLNTKVIADYSISDVSTYVQLVGDTILGFHQTTDLPRLFQSELGMGADDAQRMMSELIEFLSPVIAREEAQVGAKKAELSQLAETIETKAEHEPEPTETAADTTPVEPLRTMEGDINRIHGYGAYNAHKEALGKGDEGKSTTAPELVVPATAQTDLLTPEEKGVKAPLPESTPPAKTIKPPEPKLAPKSAFEYLSTKSEPIEVPPTKVSGAPKPVTAVTPAEAAPAHEPTAPPSPPPTTSETVVNEPVPPAPETNTIPLRKVE